MARFLVTLLSLVSLNAVLSTAEPAIREAAASADSRFLLSACEIPLPDNDSGLCDAEPGSPGQQAASYMLRTTGTAIPSAPPPVAAIRGSNPIRAPPSACSKS